MIQFILYSRLVAFLKILSKKYLYFFLISSFISLTLPINVYGKEKNYFILLPGLSFSKFNPIGLNMQVLFDFSNATAREGLPVLIIGVEYGIQVEKISYGMGLYGMIGMSVSAITLKPHRDFDTFKNDKKYHGVEVSLILFAIFEIFTSSYNLEKKKTVNDNIQEYGLRLSFPILL